MATPPRPVSKVILVSLALVVLAALASYFVWSRKNDTTLATSATPATTVTPAASATPTPSASATPTAKPTSTPVAASALTLADLNAATYTDPQKGTIVLKDGKYAIKGTNTLDSFSASIDAAGVALGDLNGDGKGDAIVTLQNNYGGSGVFPYVYVVINQNGKAVSYPSTPAFLQSQDTVMMHSASIKSGMVVLDASTHAKGDTKLDQSIRTTTSYKVVNNALVPAGTLANTFENSLAGFRLTYPGDWSFNNPQIYADGIALVLDSPTSQTKVKSANYDGGWSLTVAYSETLNDFIAGIDSKNTSSTLQAFLASLKTKGTIGDYTSTTIGSGSYSAYKISGYTTFGLAQYWLTSKGHVYNISVGTDEDASNTILKSLVLL